MSLNSIGCVTAQKLTNKCAPVATYFNDFGQVAVPNIPVTPPVPPEYDTNTFILCAANGDRIRVTHKWLETNTSGTPDVTLATNLTTGLAYALPLTSLVACSDIDQESDGEAWCAGTVEYTRYQLMSNGAPVFPAVVYWVNDITGVSSNVMPVGATKGKCIVAPANTNVTPHGLNIASGSFIATHDPDLNGVSFDLAPITNLQSFTVTVSEGGSVPSSADTVRLEYPNGSVLYLIKSEVKTYSVAQQIDGNETITAAPLVKCYGNSAATIIYGTN